MKALTVVSAIVLLLVAAAARAQGMPPTVPATHIPPSVLAELRRLENQFDLALATDCASERCFSKGCVYGEHASVDKPRAASLPGLGESHGPGSVPLQEYLTQARCEFTYERSVGSRDVMALVRRLEQKLSKGWLVVTVGHKVLAPVSGSLREPPAAKEEPFAPVESEPEEPLPPLEWNQETAARELWLNLLPHFAWMVALVMVTLAALVVIWAFRRLGRESVEEKALAAQLARGDVERDNGEEEAATVPEEAEAALTPEVVAVDEGKEAEFVAEQKALWQGRIAGAELNRDDDGILELLRGWLSAGEFALLAKAVFVFRDRLPLAFPSDGELAMRKLEFARFLRTLDENALPEDAEFFRTLNRHAIASSLLAQSDAAAYRTLHEDFGATGLASLIEALPARHGALLFALAPAEYQHEVARIMTPELRNRIAEQLLVSNRISKDETASLFAALRAVRAGESIPSTQSAEGLVDMGREIDAAGALSVLLPHVEEEARSALFANVIARGGGALPDWHQQIVFAEMLGKVPEELQREVFLDVDIRGLAAWLSLQRTSWQEQFVRRLAPTMQQALRASMAFGSRADQLNLAERGRVELAAAVQRLVAHGRMSFADMVV